MKTADELATIVANECLAGRVRRLNRLITGLYDRALQPYGIKVSQVGILVVLLVARPLPLRSAHNCRWRNPR